MNTPLAFIVFNRPETTLRVFELIRQIEPTRLFIIADGPREKRDGEAKLCAEVRAIVENITWPCDVQRNYSDSNMGCKHRVSSGLDWLFSSVEEAIILEDDCLPDPSFFPFCEELLRKFRNDERIGHISGINFQFENKQSDDSYYFSRYPHVWGWATWRRAWQDYDVKMKYWPSCKSENKLLDVFGDERLTSYWEKVFSQVHDGLIDTWDYQWTFTALINSRLSITPQYNLVSNIGFGEQATHTIKEDRTSNIPTSSMEFPLKHPRTVLRNSISDFRTDLLYLPSVKRVNIWKKIFRSLLSTQTF